MVNIGVLTSSRADFGVYLPLLKGMKSDSSFNLSIIAFGTHLSRFHGYTIDDITANGFEAKYTVPTLLVDDSEEGISTSTALCSMKFSTFWTEHSNEFDLVLCLGDRYEMFAAVSAGIPYGIKFGHFYGGDVSLGAIDNVYRDCLTHMSSIHFTSTKRCAERVKVLKNEDSRVTAVGILSLDDLRTIQLETIDSFETKWDIDLAKPTILVTFHPETIHPEFNEKYAEVAYQACLGLSKNYQVVITMPNADTEAFVYRKKYELLKDTAPDTIFLIENFGRVSYFTCMKHCLLMIGNTSSGISEAASFGKYYINVGDRQKGREVGANVLNTSFDSDNIIKMALRAAENPVFTGDNIYERRDSVKHILELIKKEFIL